MGCVLFGRVFTVLMAITNPCSQAVGDWERGYFVPCVSYMSGV